MSVLYKRIVFDESAISLFDEYDVDIREMAMNEAVRLVQPELRKNITVQQLVEDDPSIWIATVYISGVTNEKEDK